MSEHAARAARLLVNYFSTIAAKAGMTWDRDYTIEIGEAVEAIVTAAIEGIDNERLVINDNRFTNLDERLIEVVRRLDKHERQLRDGGL